MVTACVAKYASGFRNASPRLRANLDLARVAVAKDPLMLEHAAESLRDGASLVELALRQSDSIFKFESARLRGEAGIVRLAIEKWKGPSYCSSRGEYQYPYNSGPTRCRTIGR